MKITPKNPILKFQDGGAMPPEEMAPEGAMPAEGAAPEEAAAPGGQLDPIMMLALMAALALQAQDCNMAMQVCQGFIQLVQGAAQQGGGAPEGLPMYRAGGRMVKRVRR